MAIGTLKKLVDWLNGDDDSNNVSSSPHSVSPRIKIKVFNKRLARMISKMEIQEARNKKKAQEALNNGDKTGARIYMKNSLQYRKWAHATEKFKMRMEGVEMKLDQAKMISDFSGVAQDIVGTLRGLQQQVKMPEVSKMLSQLDMGFGKIDAVLSETSSQLELSDDASSTAVSEKEVDEALEEVDLELSANSLTALPEVPQMQEKDVSIEDLEQEIKKLKEKNKI
ncbi:MAG: Snf7 family protein [Promethearchaeota archaeon]